MKSGREEAVEFEKRVRGARKWCGLVCVLSGGLGRGGEERLGRREGESGRKVGFELVDCQASVRPWSSRSERSSGLGGEARPVRSK